MTPVLHKTTRQRGILHRISPHSKLAKVKFFGERRVKYVPASELLTLPIKPAATEREIDLAVCLDLTINQIRRRR